MINNLPTYKIKVNPDDESGVYAVSLVDEPAIEVDWIHLSKIVEMEFAANKDKQMLFGPLLIPGKLIFRRDSKGNEYNIVFDEETIQLIADKFNENKLGDAFNFQHSDKLVEAVLLQNWITGEIDKSQEFGFSLPQGTWFGGVKVKDESFWLNDVKSGKVKGFSVEIKAGLELVELNKINIKLQTMELKTKNGDLLSLEGEMVVGAQVSIKVGEEFIYAEAGDYELEDGTILVLDIEGKIAEIKEMEAPETQEPADEELTEEEVAVTEEVSTDLVLDPQEVMDIVAPMFEEMRAVHAEMMAKIAELEAKIGELENGTTTEMEELKSKVETLSKSPAIESLSKKSDDKRVAKEAILMNKINAFSRK
jgi:hypothetical protein